MKRKIVYICSPLRGDAIKNSERAARFCQFAYEKGRVPIAPHLYFPMFLDDFDPKERKAGMAMGNILLKHCDEMWVFGPVISEGMQKEIVTAVKNGIGIRYYDAHGGV